ncbi:MAG: hypothetical protein RL284_1568, partial [Bacteroidota bacterium]
IENLFSFYIVLLKIILKIHPKFLFIILINSFSKLCDGIFFQSFFKSHKYYR